MLVLVISECTHQAWEQTRRIVDAYLERVGRRTWRGHLSSEGLRHLRSELAATASRSTAVACHRVLSRDRFDLEWIIGSNRPFGPDGVVTTYKGHAYDQYLQERPPLSPGLQNLSEIVNLAGLFHDLGKANPDFQAKLRQKGQDLVRHEILSALAFEAWAAMTGDPRDDLHSILKRPLPVPQGPFTFDQGLLTNRNLAAWLIATHHRLLDALPITTPGQPANTYTLAHHLFGPPASTPLEQSLNPIILASEVGERLRATNRDHLSTSISSPMFEAMAAYGRLALILADQLVSSEPIDLTRHPAGETPKGALLANTVAANSKTIAKGKQILSEHLIKVADQASTAVSDLHDIPLLSPSLPAAGLPRPFRAAAAGRFTWQNDAVAALQANLPAEAGFFGVLLASTGSGKTRAAARLMSNLRADIRYSLCLALRSLTLQAADDYRKQMDLSETDIAVVIGDPAVQLLATEDDSRLAADTPLDDLFEMIEVEGGDLPHEQIPLQLTRHLRDRPKSRRLLAAPILIATIDQLMPAADMRRSGFTTAALRLLTADLLIDEADAFDPQDLIAIGRLVHLAGLFGRNVLISSATIPPSQILAFWKSWRTGYSAHAALMEKPDLAYAGLFSDQAAPLVTEATADSLSVAITNFTHCVAQAATVAPSPRRGALLPQCAADDPVALFKCVTNTIRANHVLHGQLTDKANKRLSIQLIHFAHVDTCVSFAAYLDQNKTPGCSVRHIVYHARHPLLIRSEIERYLDRILRRNDNDKALLKDPILRAALQEANEEGLAVVVIATSVEEIGRDHDFDAAIVEPHSMRSIIQLAGRVQRHRLIIPADPNVWIMPAPFRFVKDQFVQMPYRRPGVEGHSPLINTSPYALQSPWLSDLVANPGNFDITAAERLEIPSHSGLSALEHQKLDDHLNGPAFHALTSVHDGRLSWTTATHPNEIRFRGSGQSPPDLQVYWRADIDRFFVMPQTRHDKPVEWNVSPATPPPEKALLQIDPIAVLRTRWPAAFERRPERLMQRFLRAAIPNSATSSKDRWTFHPQLGLFRA